MAGELVKKDALVLVSDIQGFTSLSEKLDPDHRVLAFRLEKMTRDLDARAVVSGDVFQGWDEGQRLCRPLGTHPVKDREQPVEVFALDDLADA